MKKRKGLRAAALLSAVSVAALGGTAAAARVDHKVANASKAVINVAFDDTPDVGGLPMLAAMQDMQKQGYTIKENILSGPATVSDAVQAGDAQIGTMNGISLFQAVVNGAPFVMFAEKYANEIALVTKSSITSPSQLSGKNIGVESPTASSTSLMLYTDRTLHVTPNLVYIAGSAARLSALLTGQLDGSPLELDDVVKVLGTNPTQFHVLINFDKEFPWLLGNVIFAQKSYISAHKPEIQQFTTDLYAETAAAYAHPLAFMKKWGHLLTGYTQKVLNDTMTESASEKIWGDSTIKLPDVARTISFDESNGLLTAAQGSELKNTLAVWFYPSFGIKAKAAYLATNKK